MLVNSTSTKNQPDSRRFCSLSWMNEWMLTNLRGSTWCEHKNCYQNDARFKICSCNLISALLLGTKTLKSLLTKKKLRKETRLKYSEQDEKKPVRTAGIYYTSLWSTSFLSLHPKSRMRKASSLQWLKSSPSQPGYPRRKTQSGTDMECYHHHHINFSNFLLQHPFAFLSHIADGEWTWDAKKKTGENCQLSLRPHCRSPVWSTHFRQFP